MGVVQWSGVTRTRSLLPVVALLVLALSPQAASAVTLAEAGPDLESGPFIVGSALAWTEVRCTFGCRGGVDVEERYKILLLRGAGRPPQVVDRGRLESSDTGNSSSSQDVTLEASSGVIARLRFSSSSPGAGVVAAGGANLAAGVPGGPLRDFYECLTFDRPPYAAHGDALIYVDPCEEATPPLFVVNLSSGTTERVPVDPEAQIVALAANDRYVAYLDGKSGVATVYDRASDSVGYSADQGGPFGRATLAVGEDGALALLRPNASNGFGPGCGTTALSWSTPADPAVQFLPVRPCGERIALSGREVLFQGEAPSVDGVRAISFEGVVREVVQAFTLGGSFDTEGDRLSYAQLTCRGGFELRVAGIDERRFPRSGRCPLDIRSQRARVRRGRVRVAVECRGGCRGRITVRRGATLVAHGAFNRPRGRSVLNARLTKAGRRLVGRGLPTMARLKIVRRERAGGSRATRARVTLLR